jgi:sugar transferase (PEP-CTERM system associated)
MYRLFRHYVPGMVVAAVIGDVLVIVGAIVTAWHFGWWVGQTPLWPKVMSLTGIIVCGLYVSELYDARRIVAQRELGARLLLGLLGSGTLAAALGFALPVLRFGRLAFIEILLLSAVGLMLWRLTWLRVHVARGLRERVLVLGVGPAAGRLVELQTTGARPFTVVGFLSDAPGAFEELPSGTELVGKARDILAIVEELQPDVVVVALRDMRGAFPASDLLECRTRGIRVEDWPSFYEKQTGKILVTGMRPSWLIFSDGFVKTRFTQMVKRAVDIALSLLGLTVAAPLMALVAILVKLDSKGPVLFRQERVGQYGRVFVLKKFRSMRVDAERDGHAVWASEDDPRATRIGRFLRRSRLDELPQLVNILVGEMSFIGPRPERPEFVQRLQQRIPFYVERHSVKPGLTGWAQVRHPYTASVEGTLEKLQYDLYYIKNLSLFLDMLILVSTVQVVLFGRGAR